MPTTIDETVITATEAAPIVVPVGADNRTAESLMTAWTGIAARFKFLEAFYELVKGFVLGGAVTLTDALAYTLNFNLTFLGGATVDFQNTYVKFARNVVGPLFDAGTSGRAPKKVLVLTPASGSTTAIDPTFYDDVYVTPAGACTLVITPSAVGLGDFIRVTALNTSVVAIKQPDGTTTIRSVSTSAGAWRTVEFVNLDGGAVWTAGPTIPATP